MFEPVETGVKFPELEEQVLKFWEEHGIFKKSLEVRSGCPEYVFYEGPPTANGRPGVHHVQARAYKDLFPRYKTMRGFQVQRKAGWDCHGLPVELEVDGGEKAGLIMGLPEAGKGLSAGPEDGQGADQPVGVLPVHLFVIIRVVARHFFLQEGQPLFLVFLFHCLADSGGHLRKFIQPFTQGFDIQPGATGQNGHILLLEQLVQ